MSGDRWWIQAEGRSFGPYAAARLPAFRDEGRLAPTTLIARDGAGPFAAAADTPELAALFSSATSDSGVAPGTGSGRDRSVVSAAEDAGYVDAGAGGDRTLVVSSDAAGAEASALEAALGAYGEAVRVRPGLWLLRAREGAAPVRNALSRRLGADAMLLVVEAPLAAAAWFNLGEEADRALRRLWTG